MPKFFKKKVSHLFYIEKKMTKSKIAIDIDGVLSKTMEHFVDYINAKYNTSFQIEDINEYEMNNLQKKVSFDIYEELINYIKHNLFLFEVYEEADIMIRELALHYDLYIITSRSSLFEQATIEWLYYYFSYEVFTQIHFLETTPYTCKSEFCENKGVEFLLEDAPHYADATRAKGIYVLLFSRPWNQEVEECGKLLRVNGWREAKEKIIELSQVAH